MICPRRVRVAQAIDLGLVGQGIDKRHHVGAGEIGLLDAQPEHARPPRGRVDHRHNLSRQRKRVVQRDFVEAVVSDAGIGLLQRGAQVVVPESFPCRRFVGQKQASAVVVTRRG